MKINKAIFAALALICLTLMIAILPSQAHAFGHKAPFDTQEGRPLSILMHDQIPVVANNYGLIVAFSRKLLATEGLDAEARAALADYLGYAETMHKRSMGGWVPGTMSYDWNPYHVTYHASLRAAFEALTILKANAQLMPAGGQLFDSMNDSMYGLLSICANTFDEITTASDVSPNWSSFRDVRLLAPPPLSAFIGLGLVGTFVTLGFIRRRRQLVPVRA